MTRTWEGPLEYESGRFLATRPRAELSRCQVALLGAPLDETVSYRPGTRFGPGRVRQVSWALETYSPDLDADLEEIPVCDLGDLALPIGDLGGGLERIQRAARELGEAGKRFVIVGGEHSLTPAAVRGLLPLYPDLAVLQFDAHADLRDDYLGVAEGHASAMRRVADAIGFARLAQVGLRSGTREEFSLARRHGTFLEGELMEAVDRALQRLGDRPLYVTVDLDVCDPAWAPGVGTPEPGGLSSVELLAALKRVAASGRVVAADVVEVCPPYDHGDVTAVLGAKVVRELLLSLGCRRDGKGSGLGSAS